MPRSRHRFKLAEIEANLTPMIDVSFLLIVFFALVSGVSRREQVPLELSQVAAGGAARPAQSARWVLNVLPEERGATGGYVMNGLVFPATPAGLEQLAQALADGYRANPGLAINLRADRATAYRYVEPAMRAATTGARLAGGGALPRLNLVVEELREGPADVQ